jgi:5'-nucleotidase
LAGEPVRLARSVKGIDVIVSGHTHTTAPDVFRIMSLGSGSDDVPGYPLAKVYVTGEELKNILDILLVAYKSSPSNYCFYSGFRADYDPGRGLLRKISKIELVKKDRSSRDVDFSGKNKTLFSVTANSYMLEYIGIIKKMSFGLINVVPKDQSGMPVRDMRNSVIDINENMQGIQEGKEWLAMMELPRSMKDADGDSIPDIDRKYALPIRSFEAVSRR